MDGGIHPLFFLKRKTKQKCETSTKKTERNKMASKRYAKIRARSKARQIFRANRRKSKTAVLKKFSNFAGKVTFMKVLKTKGKSRRFGRTSRRFRRSLYRKGKRRMYRRMRR